MKVMKGLHKLIFTFAMVIGLSLAVCAQKDDQKKPPKPPPPVITPKPKPDENKPKKPSSYEAVWKIETRETA